MVGHWYHIEVNIETCSHSSSHSQSSSSDYCPNTKLIAKPSVLGYLNVWRNHLVSLPNPRPTCLSSMITFQVRTHVCVVRSTFFKRRHWCIMQHLHMRVQAIMSHHMKLLNLSWQIKSMYSVDYCLPIEGHSLYTLYQVHSTPTLLIYSKSTQGPDMKGCPLNPSSKHVLKQYKNSGRSLISINIPPKIYQATIWNMCYYWKEQESTGYRSSSVPCHTYKGLKAVTASSADGLSPLLE